jgi:hypothetical protein
MADGDKWTPWRRGGRPAPGSDMSDMTELDLIDVTLVTEYAGARAEVPRLGLAFNEGGMTVRRADGAPYVRIPWQFITELSADVVGSQRDVSTKAVALDVQSSRKRHHFVVPNVQLAALTGSLSVLSQRYGRGALVAGGKGRRH